MRRGDGERVDKDGQRARGRPGPHERAGGRRGGWCGIDVEQGGLAPAPSEPRVPTSTAMVGGIDARLDRRYPELERGAGTAAETVMACRETFAIDSVGLASAPATSTESTPQMPDEHRSGRPNRASS